MRKSLLAVTAVLAVITFSKVMVQTCLYVLSVQQRTPVMEYQTDSNHSDNNCSALYLSLNSASESDKSNHGFKWIVDSTTSKVLERSAVEDMSMEAHRALRFDASHSIAMPFSCNTLPAEEILRQNWTNQIQDFLRSCSKSSPVAVVAANYPYRDVVINWLIAARVKVEPPLENILVISFDSPLHELLQHVGIKSVLVPPDSLASQHSMYAANDFQRLLMARVTILRLINHWGYDVAHYDTDAIILKNPLPLYNKHADSDVVGSTGTFPKELGRKWGFTLCMGTILFRSTPETELFWYTVSRIDPGRKDDQVKINNALAAMNVTWDGISGGGKGVNGFQVTALSQNQVCRMRNCRREEIARYYVWHKGGAKKLRASKIRSSAEIGSWYLKEDWENITMVTMARGVEWLRKMSVS